MTVAGGNRVPVEILRSADSDNRIGVGECGEDTDSARHKSAHHVPRRTSVKQRPTRWSSQTARGQP